MTEQLQLRLKEETKGLEGQELVEHIIKIYGEELDKANELIYTLRQACDMALRPASGTDKQ